MSIRKWISRSFWLAVLFPVSLLAQKPILSLADSTMNIYFGGKIRTTMLMSSKSVFPTSGTAYLLLPGGVAGEENTFDINARASSIYFNFDGPKVGKFKMGGMIFLYLTSNLTSENYGLLPSLLYFDLKNENWRFAFGQQMDVFAERVPNMVDAYFALAVSGCAGNSSRGQLRAERFIHLQKDATLTITSALTEPITSYISPTFSNNTADLGVPNFEGAVRFNKGKSSEAWVPFDKVELGVSGVVGKYRAFKNDANGNNIRVNKPFVWGIAGEYAFRFTNKFGIQGEVYSGQALGNYLGSIYQTTKGDLDTEIRSAGWWIEAAMFWRKNLQSRFGYGQDKCNEQDLNGAGVSKNQTFFANIVWDINSTFQVSAEPTFRRTSYVGISGNSGVGIMFAAQYKF